MNINNLQSSGSVKFNKIESNIKVQVVIVIKDFFCSDRSPRSGDVVCASVRQDIIQKNIDNEF